MTFADLVAGDSVFVDANTFIYYFGPDPVFGAVCRQLIQSIDSQQLHGFTLSLPQRRRSARHSASRTPVVSSSAYPVSSQNDSTV